MSIPLTGGVGDGGANVGSEVEAVQQRLSDLGFTIGVDGDAGPQTRRILRTYISMVSGAENAEGVLGLVEPNSLAHQWLQSDSSPRWQEMPASGVGFKNADWDAHDFGSSTLADVIRGAGQRYQDDYRSQNPGASLIETNDASKKPGGDNHDHETHEAGLRDAKTEKLARETAPSAAGFERRPPGDPRALALCARVLADQAS